MFRSAALFLGFALGLLLWSLTLAGAVIPLSLLALGAVISRSLLFTAPGSQVAARTRLLRLVLPFTRSAERLIWGLMVLTWQNSAASGSRGAERGESPSTTRSTSKRSTVAP